MERCGVDEAVKFSKAISIQIARNGEFQERRMVARGKNRARGEFGNAMKP